MTAQPYDRLEDDLEQSGFGVREQPLREEREPTPEDEAAAKVVEILLAEKDRVQDKRTATDRNTFLNEAFDKDAQYVEWDPARRIVMAIPAPRNSIRRTLNVTKPYNRAMESRLTKGQPSYQVRADQSDPMAEDVAELANDLIPWIEKQIAVRHLRGKLAFWLQRAGTAFVFNLWDDEGGEEQEIMGQSVVQGAPFADVHPPHETFHVPSTATTLDQCDGIGRIMRLSRAQATKMFPNMAGKWMSAVDTMGTVDVTRSLRNLQHGQFGWLSQESLSSSASPVEGDEDEVALVEFFLRPGAALMDFEGDEIIHFPKGARIVFDLSGQVAWFSRESRYAGLPVVRIGFTESASMWSAAPCTPLRPIQMAINWAYSLWEEHIMMAGRPIMLQPRQSRMAWRRLQDLTVRIIQWTAGPKGEKPEYLNPPNFPQTLPELLQFLLQIWQDVSGLHEVSRGQLPAAGISGVAIQLLQDQDDSQIGFSIHQLEDGLAKIMEQQLTNLQRFVKLPQLVQLAGDSVYQARLFQGTDLGKGVTVTVVPGSALPKSPAALEAKAKELWLSGVLVDDYMQPDWRRMLAITGLASEDRLYDELQQDKNNAMMEEEELMALPPEIVMMSLAFIEQTGQLPNDLMPKLYDDHIVHEARHRRRLKELREAMGREKPDINPMNVQLFEAHWQAHIPLAQAQRMGLPPMPGFGSASGQISPQLGGAGQPGEQQAVNTKQKSDRASSSAA